MEQEPRLYKRRKRNSESIADQVRTNIECESSKDLDNDTGVREAKRIEPTNTNPIAN